MMVEPMGEITEGEGEIVQYDVVVDAWRVSSGAARYRPSMT